ncbi:MotE family protein [Desulfosoma caldarium]|nr:hypothetical protein [Desulfosoma caldarium]
MKVALGLLVLVAAGKMVVTAVRLFPDNFINFAGASQTISVSEVHAQQPPGATSPPPVSASTAAGSEATGMDGDDNLVTPETWAALREQKKILEIKEMELREREARLREMEQEIENRLKELIAVQDKIKQAQKEIQAFREEREQARNAQVQALARIYGNMKPKDASQLLETLDEPLAVKVIGLMSPDQVAKILSSMDKKKAAKLSRALTGR